MNINKTKGKVDQTRMNTDFAWPTGTIESAIMPLLSSVELTATRSADLEAAAGFTRWGTDFDSTTGARATVAGRGEAAEAGAEAGEGEGEGE